MYYLSSRTHNRFEPFNTPVGTRIYSFINVFICTHIYSFINCRDQSLYHINDKYLYAAHLYKPYLDLQT